jgi:hypothetical protein
MAGDIKSKWSASTVTLAVTGLATACIHSTTWLTGWTSTSYANAGTVLDYIYSGTFTLAGSGASAGQVNIYVVSSLNDTPAWPATSAGTLGTDSSTSVVWADATMRDSHARLLASFTTTATNSRIYTFPQTGIALLFGGVVPTNHCLFIAANVNTSTAANFASGAIYQQPALAQYT